MRPLLLVLLAAALSGCATVSQVYAPSGAVGYNVDCSGDFGTWNQCYEKAGEICGARGYNIESKTDQPVEITSWNKQGGSSYTSGYRSILIVCK